MAPQFFKEENNLFAYKSHDTNSNILMELAKSAKDDALRELLVNRQTYRQVERNVVRCKVFYYRHVTHKILQERNIEGQTLLAIVEVNRFGLFSPVFIKYEKYCFRVNLAESLPIILKKEYGCHRRDILKTEQCLARQLESSMSSGQIIGELNDLENSNSFTKR